MDKNGGVRISDTVDSGFGSKLNASVTIVAFLSVWRRNGAKNKKSAEKALQKRGVVSKSGLFICNGKQTELKVL